MSTDAMRMNFPNSGFGQERAAAAASRRCLSEVSAVGQTTGVQPARPSPDPYKGSLLNVGCAAVGSRRADDFKTYRIHMIATLSLEQKACGNDTCSKSSRQLPH